MPITIPTSSIPLIPQVRDYVNSIEEVQSTQQAPPLAFAPRTSPHRAHVAASGRTYHGCTSQRTYEAATAWFSACCFAACTCAQAPLLPQQQQSQLQLQQMQQTLQMRDSPAAVSNDSPTRN